MVHPYQIMAVNSTLTRRDSVGDEAPSSSLRTQTARKWMDGSVPCSRPNQDSQRWREQQQQQQYRLRPTRLFHRHERNGRGNYLSAFVLGSLIYFMLLAGGPAVVDAKVTPNGAIVWDGNGWIPLVDDDSDHVPPPPKTDSWKRPETTMFIGVSSFRDKRCPQTLKNYFTKAKHPERLTIAIVQQNDHDDVDCVTEYCNMMNQKEGPLCPYFDNIKTLRVEAKNAAGPCYGRHLQSYMLRDEEFCMQTDSHMDVVQDWDAKLLDMWGRVNNEYGILTTYVHRIENLRDGAEKHQEVPHLCQMYFTEGNHPRYVQAKLVKNLPRPKLTTTWAAGLSVAKCHSWKAAPYDPGLRKVFDGEEFSMHARLWTRGYDTYTPDKSLVGHDYNRVTDGPAPSSWLQNNMRPGTKDRAYQRMFTLLGMPGKVDTPEMWESIGKYNLGTKRSLEQYQQFIGVNLTTLEVMGSRCGTLRHVPFEETWPPTENNLAGPYWERRLQRKGIHAVDYTPPHNSKYSRARVAPGFSSIRRQSRSQSTKDRFGVGTFFSCLLVLAAIVGCALGCANFLGSDDDTSSMSTRRRRSADRIGSSASRQARPRGRPQWSRRAEGTKGKV